MPKSVRKPTYGLHKGSGQARTVIDGKTIYWGVYGAPESREKFEEFLREWLVRSGDACGYTLTVDDLAILYADHAREHYRKDGKETATGVIEGACRHLVEDRMERSGMRWTVTNAQAMLDLRALHQSSYWDEFHRLARFLAEQD